MRDQSSKIITLAFSTLLLIFVSLEIGFVSIDPPIALFLFLSQQITNLLVYSGIFASFGFFVFSYIVISLKDRLRYRTYVFLSCSVAMYSLHCLNYFYASEGILPEGYSMIFESVSFILAALCLSISLLFRFNQRRRGIFIGIECSITALFCIGTIGIDPDYLYRLGEGYAMSLLLIVSLFYFHSHDTKVQKNVRRNLLVLLLVLFLTRLFGDFGQAIQWFSKQTAEVIQKILPLAIGIVCLVNYVFTELVQISFQVQKETLRLKAVTTNIYEYVSEGVFSIASNLRVNDTYTKVCSHIFGYEISGVEVADIMNTGEEPKAYVERVFSDIFTGKVPWKVGSELLPQQLQLNERFYNVSYQFIHDPDEGEKTRQIVEIIIKLTDITDTIELEREMYEERDKLSLSLTSILHREELLPLVNEFIDFIEDPHNFNTDVKELLNRIHTYKGNFGVFNFIHILQALHQLESDLLDGDVITEDKLAGVVRDLYKDLEIITDISGSDFFEDNLYLKANVNNLEEVYSEVRKYFYDKEASLIIYIIKKIFYRSIKDILLFYAREARKKAMEDGKEIKTIEVTGDEVFVDYEYYKNTLRSLVHIFNNCIDHGIEEEEERLISGKPKFGEISCRINDYGNFFEIIIKDDGRGVDVDSLSKKLREQGVISEEDIQNLSEEELVEYVFHAKISTHDEASTLSGRGVGLASVKNEVERVGGEIRLISFLDFGTEVKILLPKENESLISYFTLPLLMDLYVEAFKIFVKSNDIFELPLNVVGSNKCTKLYPYNVKIGFEGPEDGYFLMSCNESVLRHFAVYITENPLLSDEEFDEIRDEVLKESCNIIAGNSTSIFDLNQKYIFIKSPEIVEDQFDSNDITYAWDMMYGENSILLAIMIN